MNRENFKIVLRPQSADTIKTANSKSDFAVFLFPFIIKAQSHFEQSENPEGKSLGS